MKLELKGQKVMVTGGLRDVGRTISEALAGGQVDVVIWIRNWDDQTNEAQLGEKVELPMASHEPNGTSTRTSLWRETMGYRT
jgi:NAD(P)-dependent dehydrogenase (short-subunit alcohol dehydrogenase family)